MKKPTQAEEITKLNARVAKLEFDSKYQQDMDAMKAMEERFAPLPPEHNNNWAIIAMVIAFIALISAISISGYYKADMDRYAVALNKRILVLESAKADPKPASNPVEAKEEVPLLAAYISMEHTRCWMRVTDADGTILRESMFSNPGNTGWVDNRKSVEVRSGCPGKISYEVNGKIVHPVNKSGKPEQSEVVTIP